MTACLGWIIGIKMTTIRILKTMTRDEALKLYRRL